jgi:class 3 adenylate cyclase
MKDKDEGSHMESHRDENTMFLSDSSKDGAQAHVENSTLTGRPIADLFPHATVLFGDIAGFTAWSSTREPPQVFILLESLYALFDSLAIKRKVFKVETIGDCYMAVVGLPGTFTTFDVWKSF